jgi:poly(ADP-ribose) glycohydrolase ARH3
LAIESSRPTHSHPLAYQGATLQALSVAIALTANEVSAAAFLSPLRAALTCFADLLQDTSPFTKRLDAIERGLAEGRSAAEVADVIGTGIEAFEAVPMALYCFLRHPVSFVDAVREAIFLGGDTDTIASMTGAIAGARLGRESIPTTWLAAVREEPYTPAAIEELADRLFVKLADTE